MKYSARWADDPAATTVRRDHDGLFIALSFCGHAPVQKPQNIGYGAVGQFLEASKGREGEAPLLPSELDFEPDAITALQYLAMQLKASAYLYATGGGVNLYIERYRPADWKSVDLDPQIALESINQILAN